MLLAAGTEFKLRPVLCRHSAVGIQAHIGRYALLQLLLLQGDCLQFPAVGAFYSGGTRLYL